METMPDNRPPEEAVPAPPPEGAPASTGDGERRSLGWVITQLALHMREPSPKIPPGDQAALRRLQPGEGGGPAFWKIAVHYLEPSGWLPAAGASYRDDVEQRWAAILAAVARLKDQHPRDRERRRKPSLGAALHQAGVSEGRVLRLLRARDEALLTVVRTVSHQLASEGVPVDLTDLAELVLSDGAPSDWENAVRRRIAMDFYRTRHHDES